MEINSFRIIWFHLYREIQIKHNTNYFNGLSEDGIDNVYDHIAGDTPKNSCNVR